MSYRATVLVHEPEQREFNREATRTRPGLAIAGLHTVGNNYRAHSVGRIRETSLLCRMELDGLDARLHGLFPGRLLNVQALRSRRFRGWVSNVRPSGKTPSPICACVSFHRTRV